MPCPGLRLLSRADQLTCPIPTAQVSKSCETGLCLSGFYPPCPARHRAGREKCGRGWLSPGSGPRLPGLPAAGRRCDLGPSVCSPSASISSFVKQACGQCPAPMFLCGLKQGTGDSVVWGFESGPCSHSPWCESCSTACTWWDLEQVLDLCACVSHLR